MKKEKKEELIMIRVSSEDKEKIKALAKKEYRTVSNYILNKCLNEPTKELE